MATKRAPTQSSSSASTTKRRKIADANVPSAQQPEVPQKPKQKAKHVRFDGEADEADFAARDISNDPPANPAAQEFSSDEDDDDAPDTISTSAAQKRTKDSLASVSKAVSQQRNDEKRKRKERDTRLKAQSKSTKSKKAAQRAEAVRHDVDSDADRPLDTAPVPVSDAVEDREAPAPSSIDLLPAHLLEEDFAPLQTPSPPPSPLAQSRSDIPQGYSRSTLQKQKLDARALYSQPQDKQAGPVTVSVLQKSHAFLAPKADGKSKALREGWLSGRRGRGGKIAFQRKPVNANFVRH